MNTKRNVAFLVDEQQI